MRREQYALSSPQVPQGRCYKTQSVVQTGLIGAGRALAAGYAVASPAVNKVSSLRDFTPDKTEAIYSWDSFYRVASNKDKI